MPLPSDDVPSDRGSVLDVDVASLGIVGHSSGGHLALLSALCPHAFTAADNVLTAPPNPELLRSQTSCGSGFVPGVS